ncbi:hypothetical protein GCM10022403_033720 [Streptomyces coacervatus]|uniref:Uncharacterized protein n=1 Tax=Streptomyces coacervatus TaxID=647381 RepID=A0ABP7HQI3_9ACTN|nr:hypothetical protein [Streptomyces coacervatus]MDF2272144.1 hypothetical protein [Streptomyces coacervatus]
MDPTNADKTRGGQSMADAWPEIQQRVFGSVLYLDRACEFQARPGEPGTEELATRDRGNALQEDDFSSDFHALIVRLVAELELPARNLLRLKRSTWTALKNSALAEDRVVLSAGTHVGRVARITCTRAIYGSGKVSWTWIPAERRRWHPVPSTKSAEEAYLQQQDRHEDEAQFEQDLAILLQAVNTYAAQNACCPVHETLHAYRNRAANQKVPVAVFTLVNQLGDLRPVDQASRSKQIRVDDVLAEALAEADPDTFAQGGNRARKARSRLYPCLGTWLIHTAWLAASAGRPGLLFAIASELGRTAVAEHILTRLGDYASECSRRGGNPDPVEAALEQTEDSVSWLGSPDRLRHTADHRAGLRTKLGSELETTSGAVTKHAKDCPRPDAAAVLTQTAGALNRLAAVFII